MHLESGLDWCLSILIWALIMNGPEFNEFRDRFVINAVLRFTVYNVHTGSDANVQKYLMKPPQ